MVLNRPTTLRNGTLEAPYVCYVYMVLIAFAILTFTMPPIGSSLTLREQTEAIVEKNSLNMYFLQIFLAKILEDAVRFQGLP